IRVGILRTVVNRFVAAVDTDERIALHADDVRDRTVLHALDIAVRTLLTALDTAPVIDDHTEEMTPNTAAHADDVHACTVVHPEDTADTRDATHSDTVLTMVLHTVEMVDAIADMNPEMPSHIEEKNPVTDSTIPVKVSPLTTHS